MKDNDFTKNSIEASIRLGLLLLLAILCFRIIHPFLIPVLWGVIIAVAIYPLFTKFKAILGGRNKLASILYTLVALAMLITPTIMVSSSVIDTTTAISNSYEAGTLEIPPPNDKVKDWPLIGEKVYKFWTGMSTNLTATLSNYGPQLKQVSKTLLSAAAGVGGGILKFVFSIIISGILVANAAAAQDMTRKIFSRLTNAQQGEEYTNLSKATIRSVAQGVLGVAAIQAVLSALGMVVMDVPAWGLWSLIIMVLAIAQLPPLLVLGFVMAYVFSVADTTPAVVFAIYCLVISASDGFLKPLFLGRGMATPMLVILLGAIGGMMMSGIIGLFVGAIVLALGYELFLKWLNYAEEPEAATE